MEELTPPLGDEVILLENSSVHTVGAKAAKGVVRVDASG